MALNCKSVLLRLDDMQDLSLIFEGKLYSRTSQFGVKELLDDLKKLTEFKASIRNAKVNFQILYDSSNSFDQLVMNESL